MSARTARWIALLSAALTVAGLAGGVWLAIMSGVTLDEFTASFAFTTIAIGLSYTLLGCLLVTRHPSNVVGWLLLALGVPVGATLFVEQYAIYSLVTAPGSLPFGTFAAWVGTWIWMPSLGVLPLVLLMLPDGSLPSRRWRPVAWYAIAMAPLSIFGEGIAPDATSPALPAFRNPLAMPELHARIEPVSSFFSEEGLLAIMIVGLVGLVLRYRRSGSTVRHQLRWVAFSTALAVAIMIPLVDTSFGPVTNGIALSLIPSGIAIAVLRYRLFDIDVVISKTVVFAGLAGFITAIYVGIVVGVGTLLGAGDEPNLALSIVATAVVAVAFQPVRERLTRVANRLVFGRRATPYEVLSTFSSHLAEVAAPEQTLERMARLLVDGTGAARAQVWLQTGGELRPAATWPSHATDGAAPEHLVDVVHEGEVLGALSLDKQRGETLTPADIKLVDDLAAQAGLVLRNLKLTEDLKAKIVDLTASRQRLVAAQDAERRRLERDLHDGAQRQLLELKSRLSTASSTAATEQAERAAQILDQVTADADDAVATLRELAHGIFPPLLAAEGLAGALTAQASKAAVPVVVEPDGIGRYPQDIEAAVYFCVLEAVQNAAKYASPSQVTVRLAQTDGQLTFEVSDDGTGFDPTTTPKGHGTTNMTDRLEALGGSLRIDSHDGEGTVVRGSLPVPVHAGRAER